MEVQNSGLDGGRQKRLYNESLIYNDGVHK